MSAVFEQVFILFAFAAIGYALVKCGVAKHEHGTLLSRLLVYVFLPANIVKTFARNCTIPYITTRSLLMTAAVVIVLVLAVVMHFAAKLLSRDKAEQGAYEYSMIVPNSGYMGYAFAEAIFGTAGLMDVMMFCIPLNVYIYTVGYCILSRKKITPRSLLNPTTVAMLLGLVLGLTGVGGSIPAPVYGLLDKASVCMAPTSMLLLGVTLAEFGIPGMLKRPPVYIVSFVRLLAMPLLLGGLFTLLDLPLVTRCAVLVFCMPCGLNTVVFAKNAGEDCSVGAGLSFVSTVLSCATIPLMAWIFGLV